MQFYRFYYDFAVLCLDFSPYVTFSQVFSAISTCKYVTVFIRDQCRLEDLKYKATM